MNKQEQIEKMAIAMCKDPVGCDFCHHCFKGEFDCDEHMFAENAVEEGYINGADFVEWLKSSRFVKPYMDDIDYCMGIDIEVLAEALQEYLKGE